jgi:POT family proton-dependent oligopeptide transporter
MLVSLLTYVLFQRHLPDRKTQAAAEVDGAAVKAAVKMTWEEEKKRLVALGLVFLVVIFFWMSFHQNGLTLTMFARDYTEKAVGRVSNLIFDIWGLLSIAAFIIGLVFVVRKASATLTRGIGAALIAGGAAAAWYLYGTYQDTNPIEPEIFQQFNPYFVVFLTPVVVGLFGWLRDKGKEPSTPRKIGIGMILAAVGFVIMIFSSLSLTSLAHVHLLHPDRGRALPQPHGHLLRLQGLATPLPGAHAGRLARRHGPGQQAPLRRLDHVGHLRPLDRLDRLRRLLPDFRRLHLQHPQEARSRHQLGG